MRENLDILLATRFWEKDEEANISDAPKAWESLTTEDGFTELELKGKQKKCKSIVFMNLMY